MTGAWEGREYGLKRRGSRDVWKMHGRLESVLLQKLYKSTVRFLESEIMTCLSMFFFGVLFPFEDDKSQVLTALFFFHLTLGMNMDGFPLTGFWLRSSMCFHSFAILGYSTYVLGPVPMKKWSRNWTCVTLVAFNKRVTCPYTLDN